MPIDSISFGEITIKGKTYYSDVVVTSEDRVSLLEKTHIISPSLVRKILEKRPDSIVVGVGLEGTVHIHPAVKAALKKKNIRLFVDNTENAVEIFNALQGQRKKVAGIMHITL